MKKWISRCIRSKTIIFSLLLSILGVVQASMGAFSHLMTPETAGLVAVAVGAIVAALRVVTTQKLIDK